MKIDRLFGIVIILLNKDFVTAKELAERFEVSTRTIYRDIDVLSSAGIPIYTNKGNGGGISLLENYTINKTMLSQKDSEGLLLTLKTLQAAKYPDIDIVINKLSALFKDISVEDWVEVDFSDWGTAPHNLGKFNSIKEAILNCQSISFIYYNSYSEKTKRVVNPIKLIFKGQAWYLWAFCELKNDFRLFKVGRMKELYRTTEYFDRKELAALENYKYEINNDIPKKTVNLKLKFQPAVVYLLYDSFDEKDLVKNADGTYELDVTFPEGKWIYSFLRSFGENVEVISPTYIREELIKQLERNLKNYKI